MRPLDLITRFLAACAVAVLLPAAAPATVAAALTMVDLPHPQVPARYPGYQLATDSGDVLPYGAAASGAAPASTPPSPVTGVARTATGAGTWTVTTDGTVLASGDAKSFGSLAGQHLAARITGMAATQDSGGYWLVAADGAVFAFGNASYHGSLAGQHLTGPVVAIAGTPSGEGYWLATGDGGVHAFGDASSLGSPPAGSLKAWVTSIAPTPTGKGYWVTSADGSVLSFGDAPNLGQPATKDVHGGVVGIAPTRSGKGYWVADAEGTVFSFGDAPYLGAAAGRWGRVVGITGGAGRPVSKAEQELPARLRNERGNDVSWPQCDGPMPGAGGGFGIIGVTDGAPFTRNPCLAAEWRWATTTGAAAVYVNIASAVQGGAAEMHGPAGTCGLNDLPCQTYNSAANTIGDALAYAKASGVDSPMWWLDVETMNRWTENDALNTLTVRAAVETLAKAGIKAGVYSTTGMWRDITGGAHLPVPSWVAAIVDDAGAPALCHDAKSNFTGGGVWLVQSLPVQFDVDYACPRLFTSARGAFRFGR